MKPVIKTPGAAGTRRRWLVWESLELDSEEDNKVGLAEWNRNKKLVSCSLIKTSTKKYSFDVNKAD
jgi:hypothetical protein